MKTIFAVAIIGFLGLASYAYGGTVTTACATDAQCDAREAARIEMMPRTNTRLGVQGDN